MAVTLTGFTLALKFNHCYRLSTVPGFRKCSGSSKIWNLDLKFHGESTLECNLSETVALAQSCLAFLYDKAYVTWAMSYRLYLSKNGTSI